MAVSRAGRVRNAPAANPQPGAAAGGDSSWMHRGQNGVAQADAEQSRIEERRATGGQFRTWRFWLTEGDRADVILLDHNFDNIRFFYEHNLQDSQGKWSVHETCPKEWENCPLCQQYSESYYVMMLTVLDLREFVVKAGTPNARTITHSRRLLPVKVGQIPEYTRLAEVLMAQHGTMRGAHLLLERSAGGQSTRIGHMAMLDNGQMFEMISEEDLVAEFGHPEVRSQQNPSQIIKVENQDIMPVAYDIEFPRPSADDIRQRYGLGTAPGSAAESAPAQPQGGYVTTTTPAAPAAPAAPPPARSRTAPVAPATAPQGEGTRSAIRRQAPGVAASTLPGSDEAF